MMNLIPEARVDKTGKTVIRHVKPVSAPSGTHISIPAPAPAVSSGKPMKVTQRRELVKEALSILDQQPVASMKNWGNAKKNLMTLSDAELTEVTDVVRDYADNLLTANRDFLGKMLNKGKFMVEAARTFDTLCAGMPDPDDQANVTSAIWGLGNSGLLRGEDLTVPEGREAEARAHVRVVSALADAVGLNSGMYKMNPMGHSYLPEGPMYLFLSECPERADEIADIIREREITEPEKIRFILDGGSASLADGAL
jgi:hypothetical protein